MEKNSNLTELQLQHQKQMKEKRDALKKRKARTHRLIVRGAIAENALGEAAEAMTDAQFEEALFQAVRKSAAVAPCLPPESHGSVLRKEPSADHRVGDLR